jgi:hypothetical protein
MTLAAKRGIPLRHEEPPQFASNNKSDVLIRKVFLHAAD